MLQDPVAPIQYCGTGVWDQVLELGAHASDLVSPQVCGLVLVTTEDQMHLSGTCTDSFEFSLCISAYNECIAALLCYLPLHIHSCQTLFQTPVENIHFCEIKL